MTRGNKKKASMLFGKKEETRWQQEEKHLLQTIQSPILAFKPPIPSTPLNTNPKFHADTHKTSNLSPKRLKMRAQNLTKGIYGLVWPLEGLLSGSGPSLFLNIVCQKHNKIGGFSTFVLKKVTRKKIRGYYLVQACVFTTHPTWTR